jgi:polysaccharide chain length determinant protein (PEP-CTERM system associated)
MERWYLLIRQTLVKVWRQRWLVVATAWVVCLGGWVAVYQIPDSYESQARLYVDTDAILTPLLHGLAIDIATASQLEILQRTLLSRPNLDKLIGVTDLNLSVTDTRQRDQLTLRLSREIKLASDGRNLFTITYRDTDRKLAHNVVAGLVNIFMEQATGSNRADMENAQRFVNQQIASYEAQLRAAEQRRADFRRKYLDILPLENNGGSRLDNARVAVRELELQVKDALSKRAALEEEARTTPPVISNRAGEYAAGDSSQLATAQARLQELRARFTEQHPDVRIARQLVDTLKAAPTQPEPKSTPSPGDRGGIPNPVYEQIKLRLVEAAGTVSGLQERLEVARKDLARMEELARAAPQVEAEYQDLDRGYNVVRKNYEELLVRRESSNITAAADTGADKVRLRIVDPPQMPSTPVAPKRLILVSLVLLAGLGAAGALAVVVSQMDQSIGDLGRLREFGFPVLGGISIVPSAPSHTRISPQALRIGASILLLFLIYGGLAGQIATYYRIIF